MTTPTHTAASTSASRTFRSMATDVTVRIEGATADDTGFDLVEAIFADVQRECTRFDPTSPLMLANAAADNWREVPEFCFAALQEALEAHRYTDGLFDPRVLRALADLGYDRSWPFGDSASSIQLSTTARHTMGLRAARRPAPWDPGFDVENLRVRIGPEPVDLGGIGKGLAVRWAAESLAQTHRSFLIEAGGDCYLSGAGPADGRWNVGIEDPSGDSEPMAVLNLTDTACTTSSVRYRSWRVAGRPVHHLIDPRTGEPGEGGISAVTVVHPDPATAEVWSKSLFLTGRQGLRDAATRHGLAALWIDELGNLEMTQSMQQHVIWQREVPA